MDDASRGRLCEGMKLQVLFYISKFQFNPIASYDIILDHWSGVVEEFQSSCHQDDL